MNNKGQMDGQIGLFIGIFITVIIGLVLMTSSAGEIGKSTTLDTLANQSLVTVAVNDTPYVMTNCKSLSGVVIFNETNDVEVAASGYTVVNNVVTDGALTVTITPDVAETNQNIWTVDATCQPVGYIPDSGARAIAGLIIIFFAIAIMVVALIPALRSKVFNL